VRTDSTLDGEGVSLHLSGPGAPFSLAAPAYRAVGTLGTAWKELAFTYAPTAPGPHSLAVYVNGSGAAGQLEALWLDDVQAVPAEGAACIQGQGDALARVVFSSNRLREFGQFILNRRHADTAYGTVSPTDTYKLNAVPEYPVVEGYVERFDLSLDTVWMLVEFTEDAPE
jgi:hypothetical protein